MPQVTLPGGSIPADGLIPRLALPGRRSKQDTRQRTPLNIGNQTLKIFTHGAAMAQIVVLAQKSIEEGALASRRFAIQGAFAQGQREQRVQG